MENIIGMVFPQNCGDTLKILKETKGKDNRTLYECEFQKYPYKVIKTKREIKLGTVYNPEIEKIKFLNKKWTQKCGDILIILGKCENFNKIQKSKTLIVK